MTWIRFVKLYINSDNIATIEKIGHYEISIATLHGSNAYIPLFVRDEHNQIIDDPLIEDIVNEIFEELLAILVDNRPHYDIDDSFRKKLARENIKYYRLY